MNERETWQSLTTKCKERSAQFNPTEQDPKLSVLERFFDATGDLSRSTDSIGLQSIHINDNQFTPYIPAHMLAHLNKLPLAVQQHTLELWSLNLAALVKRWLIHPQTNELYTGIINAIGIPKIQHCREYLRRRSLNPNNVERALIKGYMSLIFQYLLTVENVQAEIVKKIEFAMHDFNILDQQTLDTKRIQCLKDNLKIDKTNAEHLTFWGARTHPGYLGTGGKEMVTTELRARVPSRVGNMMQVYTPSYSMYVGMVNTIRRFGSNDLPFYQRFRHEDTQGCYSADDIEYINMEDFSHPDSAPVARTNKSRPKLGPIIDV